MTRPVLCSRRHLLHAGGFGLGSLALAHLLEQDGLLAAPAKPMLDAPKRFDTLPKPPQFPARARAMISLFMMGVRRRWTSSTRSPCCRSTTAARFRES